MPVVYETVEKQQVVTEILRPDGIGDLNQIVYQAGAAPPNHWMNVNEAAVDLDTTMNYDDGGGMHYDLYHLENTTKSHPIAKMRLYGVYKADQVAFLALHEPEFCLKSGGTFKSYDLPDHDDMINGVWFADSKEFLVNPVTLAAWTKAELDALQVGCGLIRCRFSSLNKEYCTQLYVKVYYRYPL